MLEYIDHNQYQAYIFDFDGVLYETLPANMFAYENVFKKLNLSIDLSLWEKQRGMSLDQFLKTQKLDLSDDLVTEIRIRKQEVYKDYFSKVNRNEELFTFINEAKRDDKAISIASSAQQANIINLLTHFNDHQYFDFILSRNDVQHPKPHPEIYLKSLEKHEVHSTQALVFEDSLLGIESAQQAQIKVIQIDKYL